MLKTSFLFIFFVLIFSANGFAQVCSFGRGQIEVINEKQKPVKDFKVDFYWLENFDLSDRKKIIRVKDVSNAWDIFPTRKEAENYITDKSPFRAFAKIYGIDEKELKSVIFYRDNVYNYRTREHYDRSFLVRVSAPKYKNFYFIGSVFAGCAYYNKITLKKK